jgi:GTP-binding protein
MLLSSFFVSQPFNYIIGTSKNTFLVRILVLRMATSSHHSKSSKTSVVSKSQQPTITVSKPTKFTDKEFSDAIRIHRKSSNSKGIEKIVRIYSIAQKLSTNMTYTALKATQILNSSSTAEIIFKYWSNSSDQIKLKEELWASPVVGINILKLFCKFGEMSIAESIASYFGVLSTAEPFATSLVTELIFLARQDVINQLALGFTMEDNYSKAFTYLRQLNSNKMTIDMEYSKKILKRFLRNTSLREALYCMRILVDACGLQDYDSIQLINNIFLRDIMFVKGAVNMETLPEDALPEVVFMGRSNVGKSSLINMITSKKHLAFTSKTAGKTSEFNYFEAIGNVGREKEISRFHLVDVPGVGYAETSKRVKSQWTDFQQSYTENRKTLRCVFHLIDSRHGILDADEDCLSLLDTLPEYVQYVIVFTKTDKLKVSAYQEDMVKPELLLRVREVLSKRTKRHVPIIYSSSETKLGGASLLTTILESVHQVNAK